MFKKSVFSKIVTSTAAITIFLSFLKPSVAQASSSYLIDLKFYQYGFPNNGFLKGKIFGVDKDNDGYFNFSDSGNYAFNPDYDDYAFLFIDYSSSNFDGVNHEKFNIWVSTDLAVSFVGMYNFRYSILSNKLTGSFYQYDGINVDEEKTCFRRFSWSYYSYNQSYDSIECSTSPLVFENIYDNNNSKVPEPSLIAGFATLSFAFFLKNKKSKKGILF